MSLAEPERFDEPWQAEALALAMTLVESSRLSPGEWASKLGAALRRVAADGEAPGYYDSVLDALERIAVEKSLVTQVALRDRKEAWRAAYLTTPHGQPVLLAEITMQEQSKED